MRGKGEALAGAAEVEVRKRGAEEEPRALAPDLTKNASSRRPYLFEVQALSRLNQQDILAVLRRLGHNGVLTRG